MRNVEADAPGVPGGAEPAVPWWALASSGIGPLLLVGGWTIAAGRQPAGFDSIRDTISSLAARGATDRWIMTTALAGLGACYAVTGFGLRPAGTPGRVLLVGGGVGTLAVAAFPQPVSGNGVSHTIAATVAFTALGAWPVFAARRRTARAPADATGIDRRHADHVRVAPVVRPRGQRFAPRAGGAQRCPLRSPLASPRRRQRPRGVAAHGPCGSVARVAPRPDADLRPSAGYFGGVRSLKTAPAGSVTAASVP